ncbi:MAG: DJ-1/PfpI family protein [Lachnospiraceae bacterium]|nr:DJ-1/PfpI family protein [Lachnospiraceae bacterium]
MAKVLIFLADGFEEIEGLTVVDILRRAGIDIVTVSITDKAEVTGSHKIGLKTDTTIDALDFSSGDMIVLPGGMPGTKYLEADDRLMQQVDAYITGGKKVSAICAAPTILGHRGHLKGLKACCYPGLEGELTGAEVSYDAVSVAGNIITSRGLGTAVPFALVIIESILDKATADKIADSVVYSGVR